MTNLIEQIKRDREAGTPGPWFAGWGDGLTGPSTARSMSSEDCFPVGFSDGFVNGTVARVATKAAKTDARRIARVPDIEAALLAAEELAEQCEDAFYGVDAVGPQEFYLALAAYRKATGADNA